MPATMQAIVKWLTVLALQFAPPAKAHQFPGYHETIEQRTARCEAIATDIANVVDTANVYAFSRQENAVALLAFAIGETALDLDADRGPSCYRGPGYTSRCDGGLAVSLWQLHVNDEEQRAALFADRPRAASMALRGLAASFRMCGHLPIEERWAAYGSGTCDNPAGRAGSRKRWALFKRLLARQKPPKWPARKPIVPRMPDAPSKPSEPKPAPSKVAER